eukprot:m.118382 g.118382  ORF g.118382 m.118382 type:complete len:523 (+) comp16116_c0_seq1:1637-3205(+)
MRAHGTFSHLGLLLLLLGLGGVLLLGLGRLLLLVDQRGLHKRDEVAVLLRHERAEGLRDDDAAVGLEGAGLEVLQDAADEAGGGAHGGVEHVDKLGLGVELLGEAVADLQAARLIVRAVGAGHKLAESARAGEPGLQVQLLRGSQVQRARDNGNHPVGQANRLAKVLGVVHHLVEHLPRLVVMGGGDNKLLDLLELVDAEDAAGVAAVGADLLAEALRHAAVAQRQVLRVEPLAAVQGRNRLLGGGNQVLLVERGVLGDLAGLARHLVELLVKLVQLGHLLHDLLAHKERRRQRSEAPLKQNVLRQHDQRLLQRNAGALEEVAAVAGDLDATFRLDAVDHLNEVDVGVGLAELLARITDNALNAVVVLVVADRDGLVQEVADLAQISHARLVKLHAVLLHAVLSLLEVLDQRLNLGDGQRLDLLRSDLLQLVDEALRQVRHALGGGLLLHLLADGFAGQVLQAVVGLRLEDALAPGGVGSLHAVDKADVLEALLLHLADLLRADGSRVGLVTEVLHVQHHSP